MTVVATNAWERFFYQFVSIFKCLRIGFPIFTVSACLCKPGQCKSLRQVFTYQAIYMLWVFLTLKSQLLSSFRKINLCNLKIGIQIRFFRPIKRYNFKSLSGMETSVLFPLIGKFDLKFPNCSKKHKQRNIKRNNFVMCCRN